MFEIQNEFKNPRITRSIRFTEGLYRDLCKLVKENDISFNLLVLQCCAYALKHRA